MADFYARGETSYPPPEHRAEMAVSAYRLYELLHVLKDPAAADGAALAEARDRLSLPAATTLAELRTVAATALDGARRREGHVHVWSRAALAATLRSLEKLAGGVALAAETCASSGGGGGGGPIAQEYRFAVARDGDTFDANRFHRRWCGANNGSYVTFRRRAAPILLGGTDVDAWSAPPPGTPPACRALVRAVRTWDACAGAPAKAERRDCQRHASQRAADHAAVLAARDRAADADDDEPRDLRKE